MSKWSKPDDRFSIPNVPTILPPGTKDPLLRTILLRARFEELQFLLANITREAADIIRFDDELSHCHSRDSQNSKRARDSIFKERRSIISSIDSIYPVFRIPASIRIAYTKCSRKFFIPNPTLVGFIIGPRGESLRKMEREFDVRISIRGKGLTVPSKATGSQESDDLHAFIEANTEQQIDLCVKALEQLTIPLPDEENLRKKEQLKYLSILNGVVSSEAAFRDEFGSKTDQPPWFDETLDLAQSGEMDELMMALKHQLESKTGVQQKSTGKFDRFLVDLAERDISSVIPEPKVPGLD